MEACKHSRQTGIVGIFGLFALHKATVNLSSPNFISMCGEQPPVVVDEGRFKAS